MKITRSKVYSIVLLGLMILSIFQTGRLWFDGISSYNPFSREAFYTNKKVPVISENISETYNLTKPQEMVIYLPTRDPGFARISKTSGEYNSLYKYSMKILETIVNEEQTVMDLDYNLFWEGVQGGLLFNYDYTLSNSVFWDEISKGLKLNIDAIGGVDLIYIELIKSANQDAKVYLANTEEGKMMVFNKNIDHNSFNNLYMVQDESKNILEYIDKQVNIDFAFLSTKKSNKKQFVKNNYLRVPVKTEYYVNNNVRYNNPYILGRKVDEKALSDYAMSFFNHVPQNTNSEDESYYLYWDSSINLKYATTGLLEYSKSVEKSDRNQSVANAYDIAMNFVMKFLSWDEYYLVNYEVDDEGGINFAFDYSQNDYPIIIDGLDKLNLSHPINVRVMNHQVQSAQFYLIEKDAISKGKVNKSPSRDFYTDMLNRMNVSDSIENIKLAYTMNTEKSEEPLVLYWIVDTVNGETYREELILLEE